MIKNLYRVIEFGLLIIALQGCKCNGNSEQEIKVNESTATYFSEIPMGTKTGMAMVNGDFDGDGDLDLIVGAEYPNKAIGQFYLLKNENGSFSEPSHFATVKMAYGTGMTMTCGDFDNDGDLDLIVGAKHPNKTKGPLYQFNNDGNGSFSQ